MENDMIVYDENGNEIGCNVLFTFYSEEYKKQYVFYYLDDEEDDETEVYAKVLIEDGDHGKLEEIESEEEWEIVQEVFNTFLQENEE